MFVHTVIMVIEPHMKQGRQHKLISTIFLATSVTKKLDHNRIIRNPGIGEKETGKTGKTGKETGKADRPGNTHRTAAGRDPESGNSEGGPNPGRKDSPVLKVLLIPERIRAVPVPGCGRHGGKPVIPHGILRHGRAVCFPYVFIRRDHGSL